MLSPSFFSLARIHDWHLITQSLKTSHPGAVHVLLYQIINGLPGNAYPAIRDILSISTAEMGAVLFGLSIGSMSGILCSARLVKRFGTRKVIRTTMSCAVLGMAILSVALWLHSAWLFAFGPGVFGASFGAAEVAINVEGAAVEREMNKTVLPMMHGFYSPGTLAGAGVE